MIPILVVNTETRMLSWGGGEIKDKMLRYQEEKPASDMKLYVSRCSSPDRIGRVVPAFGVCCMLCVCVYVPI